MKPRKPFAAAAAILAFIPLTAFAAGSYDDRLTVKKNSGTPEQINACIANNNTAINYIAVVALQPRSTQIAPQLYSGSSNAISDAVVDGSGANPVVLGLQDPRGKIVGYVEIRSDGLEGRMTTRKALTSICETNHAIRLMDEIKNQVVAAMTQPESLIDRQTRDHKAAKPLIDRQDYLNPGF